MFPYGHDAIGLFKIFYSMVFALAHDVLLLVKNLLSADFNALMGVGATVVRLIESSE